MDSLLSAAARALATGNRVGALERIALREDPPALALRGIAMAQLGELGRAKKLLERASQGQGGERTRVRRGRAVLLRRGRQRQGARGPATASCQGAHRPLNSHNQKGAHENAGHPAQSRNQVSVPDDTYQALTTIEGLSGWWTSATRGDSEVGGTLQFRFGTRRDFSENSGFDMKVLELEPKRRVLWQVLEGPPEWVGTKVSFELRQDGDFTIVLFRHQGWKEPVEFLHHCSTKWAMFLMSLKSLVETGRGAPEPNDVKIDWN